MTITASEFTKTSITGAALPMVLERAPVYTSGGRGRDVRQAIDHEIPDS